MLAKIGIRPVIDGRQFGIRESLEVQTMNMAKAAAELITSRVRHAAGMRHRRHHHRRYCRERSLRRQVRHRKYRGDADRDTLLVLCNPGYRRESQHHQGGMGIQRYRAPRRGIPRSGEFRLCADRHALLLNLWS